MKKVDIKSIVIPNRSRSGNYPTGSTVTPSGGGSNSTIINQGGGIDLTQARKEFLSKKTSDEAKGIINFLKGIKIAGRNISNLLPKNSEEEITDEAIMSAARVILEIGNAIGKLDNKFLRKDQSDSTNFLLQLLGGAEFGKYASGISGGKIDEQGAAELLSLLLRSALTIGEYKKGLKGAKIDEEGVADLLSILVRSGIESANFSTGALGAGFCLKKDENGDSYLEVDRMLVRKVATFIQLLIQQIKHVGGQIILTPASMSCVKVEDKGDYYRCYFENTDGEKTIEQEFEVGDLARAQTFNVKEGVNDNVTNTYYWRAVVGTGDNYIDLSKTDCDAGSTEPKAGDDIVQLGNKSDATRQAAIILSAYGNDAPYFKLYRGINSYSLDGKEFVSFSRSEVMIIADTIRFSSGETIEEYINNVTGGLVVDVESAKKAAEEAQKAAAQASEDASKAVERLDKWSADGVISPTEKQSLKDEIARIDADKTQIANGYAKYNLGTPTNYNNAHTAYRAVLVTLTASTPETISIPSDFSAKQTAYYTQRTNALTAISNAARDYAQGIANDLNTYKQTVSSQFEQTNNSITAAVTSSKEYTNSAINNIQIGGRNLVLGTSNSKTHSPKGTSGTYFAYDFPTKETIDTLKGETVTASYDYDCQIENGGISVVIHTLWSNIGIFTSANNGKGHKEVTVKLADSSSEASIRAIYMQNQNPATGSLTISNFKLERGNKATDWSPAPEDAENALTEYKKEVTAQFSVMEGEINSKVSSTEMTTIKQEILNSASADATNKVNNILIGGRNYVKNSKTFDGFYNLATSAEKEIIEDSSVPSGAIVSIKITKITTTNQRGIYLAHYKRFNQGDKLAYRFFIKASRNIIFNNLGYEKGLKTNVQVTTEWQEVSNIFTCNSAPNNAFVFYSQEIEVNDVFYVHSLKLEEGTKITDWSPAPEDADNKYATITTVKSMQTDITQLSSEISLRAYKTEVTAVQNNLNQTNNNLSLLTTRVSEAEVKLQPDNIWIGISSKVTTTTKTANIVPDSCFEDANYSMLYSGGSRVSAATANNSCPTNYCMKTSQRDVNGIVSVPVTAGEKYYVSAYVNAEKANHNVAVGLLCKNASKQSQWIPAKVIAKGGGWQQIFGYITIPDGYIDARIWFQIDGSSDFGSAYFTKVYAYRVNESVNQNYALLTSNEKRLTTFNNVANQRNTLYKTSGLKKGDIVTISFEYEASNLIWNATENSYFRVQFDDKFGWTAYNIPNLKSNGTGKIITPPLTLGGSDTNIKDSNIEMVFYYISSVLQDNKPIGYFRVWNLKVEKGERATPWSAAPSDYSTTEEIKAGMQITDKGFNFFGQEFNFSGRISVGDLDPTIIEDGYLRASLINADTLVAKTLNAVNTDGVSTLVNKDGLKMTQGSNVLFKLTSNKSTVGTTRYYAQMDLTTVYSDGSTLQGTLTPESLFLRGKTKSTDKTLKTTLMYNSLMIYDENGTGLTVNTKGIQLTYCAKSQGGSNICSVVHYGKCILSAQISALGSFVHYIGGGIPNVSGTPIEFSVTKTSTGTYKVTHNIGDITYHVEVTPIRGTYFPIVCVKEKTSSYFSYGCAHYVNNGFADADCAVFVNVYYESPLLFTF